MNATLEEIVNLLVASREKRHLIVLQDFPDPDAISSAFAHQLISRQFGVEVDIVHEGRISHPENIALVRLLRIELTPYTGMDLSGYSGAIFLDNQGTTAESIVKDLESANVPFLLIVDHHEEQDRLEASISLIRHDVGATATIYTEFLEKGIIPLDRSVKDHVKVATALLHGIMTDTNGLMRANPADYHAAAFLSQFADVDLVTSILSQARSKQTMEVIHRALGNRRIVESLSISGIGYLRPGDRDAIPQAAEFLLTEENVHTAIVYGIVAGEGWNESVIGSMRTSKLTVNPDEFIKEVFGRDINGGYFGGGKVSAGGFQIPVGFLAGGSGQEYFDLKWQVFDEMIKQKINSKVSHN